MALKILLICVLGYILGSVSVAVIVSRVFLKGDVREHGSHNAGTTNMARVYGMGIGLITLAGDFLKTFLVIWLGRYLLGDMGFALASVSALVGHCWPVFFKFRGGKGVAVSGAIAIMLGWEYALALIGIFLIIAVLTRYVSLGSLIAVALLPLAIFVFGDSSPWLYGMSVFMVVTVWFMHRGNIKRLLTGTESKFKPGKRK